MSLIAITQGLTPAKMIVLKDAEQIIRDAFSDWVVNLTPEEKKKYFKMGYIRGAFADKVMVIGDQHPETIPEGVDFPTVQMQYAFYNNLLLFKNNKSDVDELIDCLIINVGIVLLASLNRIYNYAKELSEKGNYPFSELVKDAGKAYAREKQSTGTVFTINPSSQITVKKIIANSLFVNGGTTVLTVIYGDEVLSKFRKEDVITVNPGNSAKIPKGYTSITVSNLSLDTVGAFTVRLKK